MAAVGFSRFLHRVDIGLPENGLAQEKQDGVLHKGVEAGAMHARCASSASCWVRAHVRWYGPFRPEAGRECPAHRFAPALFAPGKAWCYSLSTDVLGAVIERAAGFLFPEAVRAFVTDPLGLTDTDFAVTDPARFAVAYTSEPGGARRMTDLEITSRCRSLKVPKGCVWHPPVPSMQTPSHLVVPA